MNVPQAASIWTDERVVQLRILWADGLSASQIAGAIGGVTRNAVIGKLSRLGMVGRERPMKAKKPVSAARRYQSPADEISREEKARRQAARRLANMMGWKPPVFVSEPPAESLHVSLLDLNPDSCRYPEGDGPFLFCGRPRMAGSSYCEHCHEITHYKPGRETPRAPFRHNGWAA
jgi:GcrA cell cycle regulator